MSKRKIQIGVIGSMEDVNLNAKTKKIAVDIGKEIAKKDGILFFSHEGDFDSLPCIAAKSAEKLGGTTIGFLWSGAKKRPKTKSIIIETGQLRGGGREFSFILSCDVIIAIGGGSGTLMEIAMAYQADIPVITIRNSGGWAEKLSGSYLDARKKSKIISVNNSREAVKKALESI